MDDWLTHGERSISSNPTGLTTAREVVARLDRTEQMRPALARVLETIERAERTDDKQITTSVISYSQTLSYEAQYQLSIDALAPLHNRAKRTNNATTLTTSSIRLAIAHRTLGNLDTAREYFGIAAYWAQRNGDFYHRTLAIISEAFILAMQGDFSRADTVCVDQIAEVRQMRTGENLVGVVMHQRACICNLAGQYEASVTMLERAVAYMTNPVNRRNAYADLANLLTKPNTLDRAITMHLEIAATTHISQFRRQAITSLMLAAALQSDRAKFDLYHAALKMMSLPAWQALWFHYYASVGYKAFGNYSEENYELAIARRLAAQHNINVILGHTD